MAKSFSVLAKKNFQLTNSKYFFWGGTKAFLISMSSHILKLDLSENQTILRNCNSTLIYGHDQRLIELFVTRSVENVQIIQLSVEEIFASCKSLTFLSRLELYFNKLQFDLSSQCLYVRNIELFASKHQLEDETRKIQLLLFNQLIKLLEKGWKIIASCINTKDLSSHFFNSLFDSIIRLNLLTNLDLPLVFDWLKIEPVDNIDKLEGKSVSEIQSLWNEFKIFGNQSTFCNWIEKRHSSKRPSLQFNLSLFNDKLLKTICLVCKNNFGLSHEFSRQNIQPPRGILLYGPPGSGKTSLASYVQHLFPNVSLFSVKVTDILHAEIGESEKSIDNLFQMALSSQPSVIFIDEMDSLFDREEHDESEDDLLGKLRLQFVYEINSLQPFDKLVLLAATNRKDDINEQLLSAGRFDLELEVNYPPKETIFKFIMEELSKLDLPADILQWIVSDEGMNQMMHFKSPAAAYQFVQFVKVHLQEISEPLTMGSFKCLLSQL